MKKLIIVDGNSLAHRAFYGIPLLSNSKGVITNAVYGFTHMLLNLMEQEKPDYAAVAFDISRKVFRHEQYADYKANRKGMPEELRGQMDLIKAILDKLNIPIYQMEGYEGDDIIGTMVRWAEKENIESIVVTGDKDSLQLVDTHTRVYLTKKGISEVVDFDLAKLQSEYQLVPAQICDLKGLMGDSSDNIPGVPGIGEKTALKLLHQYGTIENLYQHLEDFAGKKMGEKLAEHKEQALMSKELATIFTQVPIVFDLEGLKCKAPDLDGLIALYKELELNSLLKNLTDIHKEELTALPDDGVELTSPEQLQHILAGDSFDELAIIVDTNQKPIYDNTVLAISLCFNHNAYLIQCEHNFSDYAQILRPYLVNEQIFKLTDDSKKLYGSFLKEGIVIKGLFWDALLCAYLLNPEAKDLSLEKMLYDHLNMTLSSEEPKRAFGRIRGLEMVMKPMSVLIDQYELLTLFAQIELPLSRVLAAMEIQGVRLDIAYLEKMGNDLSARIKEITEHIYELAGSEFNLNSPKQLGIVLFEQLKLPVIKKTKTGYSTDAEVLDTLAEEHAIVKEILEYRQLSKLNSTYVEGLLNIVDPRTSKVHTSFNQTITATGRLSSTEPNLQNIPVKTELGKQIRTAFVPSKSGHLFLAADYSQIELRIMAHMSEDTVLVDSFNRDEDIHTRTAAEVFGVPMDEVTKTQRRNAKAVNFGIIYGQSDFGLSKELGITRKEAKTYIDGYFAKYHGVRQWIDQTIAQVRQDGYITTMFGRRRLISDINSKNFNLRSFAERTAVNTPIQGSAADIIKVAMIQIDTALTKSRLKAKMLLQVHDELIFEVAPHEIAILIKIVKQCMENAAQLNVPLKVDVSAGFNWFDMERI